MMLSKSIRVAAKTKFHSLVSLVAQLVKNLPAMHETLLGWEDPLEKG